MQVKQYARSFRSFAAGFIRLSIGLVLAFVAECNQPRMCPPGNVWSLGDTLASAAVLLGAWWAGRRYYQPLLFTLYGLLGGMLVGLVFLPDSRDYIRMRAGQTSPASFVLTYCTCVVVFAILGRNLGRFARERNEWRDMEVRSDPAIFQY